jgi:hypothetical protein
MSMQSGVKAYKQGTAVVKASFPIDFKGNLFLACDYCRFYRQTSRRCGLNGEIPAFPDRYIGEFCPLTFEEDKEENVE